MVEISVDLRLHATAAALGWQIVRRDHGVIGGEKVAKLMGSAELWNSEAAPLALCTTPGLVSFMYMDAMVLYADKIARGGEFAQESVSSGKPVDQVRRGDRLSEVEVEML